MVSKAPDQRGGQDPKQGAVMPNLEQLSGSPPSEPFLKNIIATELCSKSRYENLWRQDYVRGERIAADFSRKAFKAQNVGGLKLFNSTLRLMNEYQQVVLAVSSDSESFSKGAVAKALQAVAANFKKSNHKVRRIRVDKPRQDGPSLARAFGMTRKGLFTADVGAEVVVIDLRDVIKVTTAVSRIRKAAQRLV